MCSLHSTPTVPLTAHDPEFGPTEFFLQENKSGTPRVAFEKKMFD